MNYFVIATGSLYLCAAVYSVYQRHYGWAMVWGCYGISALVLSTMEGRG
jgi:hypothetical protein